MVIDDNDDEAGDPDQDEEKPGQDGNDNGDEKVMTMRVTRTITDKQENHER